MATADDKSPDSGSQAGGGKAAGAGRAAGGPGAARAGSAPPGIPDARMRPPSAKLRPPSAKVRPPSAKLRAQDTKQRSSLAKDPDPPARPAKAKPAPDSRRRRADVKVPPVRWQAVEGKVQSCLPRVAEQFVTEGLRVESGARVEGDVCARQVHVFPNAVVGGSVLALERAEVQNALVEGSVVAGSVRSSGRTGPLMARTLELARGAEVHGDVHAGRVQLDGATQVSGVLTCDAALEVPPGSRLGGVQAASVQLGRGCKVGFVRTPGALKLDADVQINVVEAERLECSDPLFLGSLTLAGTQELRIPRGSRIDVVSAQGPVVVEAGCELGAVKSEGSTELQSGAKVRGLLQAADSVTVQSGAAVREIISAATVSLPADVQVESCYAGQGVLGQEVALRVRADGEVVLEGEATGRLHSRALSSELYRVYRDAGVAALKLPQLKRASAQAVPEETSAEMENKPATTQESAEA